LASENFEAAVGNDGDVSISVDEPRTDSPSPTSIVVPSSVSIFGDAASLTTTPATIPSDGNTAATVTAKGKRASKRKRRENAAKARGAKRRESVQLAK
jgi:hypothetical protein